MRLAVVAVLLGGTAFAASSCSKMPDMRPPASERKFVSKAVDARITEWLPKFKDPLLGQLWANSFPNTLDTTVWTQDKDFNGNNYTEIITGDITAMWLRDSSAQVTPYLDFVTSDTELAGLIAGLIHRHADAVLLDAYANAVTVRNGPGSPHLDDDTTRLSYANTRVDGMVPGIFERKFELDSLGYVFLLAARFWEASGDTSPFDADWKQAARRILDVLEKQQLDWDETVGQDPYLFQRASIQPIDSLVNGRGWPAKRTGMLRSAFRGSDDSHTFPFNIPENAFVAVSLERVAPLLSKIGETETATRALNLASEIRKGIQSHGTTTVASFGQVYAFEVDGFGNALFMDGVSIPALLALPAFGFLNTSDPIYRNTRKAVFSSSNPWFFNGTSGMGVGSPHTGWDRVWPITFVTRALTTEDPSEIQQALNDIVTASACSGLMHESVQIDNPADITRPWFAWANSWLGEGILRIAKSHPEIIFSS